MIGLFDSGVGGLSVWQAVRTQLPDESTLYLADQAHCPYGPRPAAQIRALSCTLVRYLIEHGADVVVVACNTATSAAVPGLRRAFSVPIVGIEPAVKPAAALTRCGKAGVLATAGTLGSERFAQLGTRFAAGIQLFTQPCPGLVNLVEAGEIAGSHAEAQIERYVRPLLATGVDVIVLGCTHFAFLAPLIQQVAGAQVQIVDPAPAVARQTARVLPAHTQITPLPAPQHQLLTTGDPIHFAHTLELLGLQTQLGINCDIFGINLEPEYTI